MASNPFWRENIRLLHQGRNDEPEEQREQEVSTLLQTRLDNFSSRIKPLPSLSIWIGAPLVDATRWMQQPSAGR